MPPPRPPAKKPRRKKRWGRMVLRGYVVLLVLSHITRLFTPDLPPRDDQTIARVHAVEGTEILPHQVDFAYTDLHPEGRPDAPVLVLLHGSPMASLSMMGLARALDDSFRVIVPDLPGMGRSTRNVPDYSIQAHGLYLEQLLDTLDIEQAHVVAYSLGSGVALEMYEEDAGRVASIVMLSAIGVQELELLGSYHLNHAVHGSQLAFFWLLEEAFPHFGFLDGAILNSDYARNFFDSDQRPLRDILMRYQEPMLILQGKQDFQVLPAVAEEHERIVPQSELIVFEGGHELAFRRIDDLAPPIADFVERTEQGRAATRTTADAGRRADAEVPFDPADVPQAEGFTLIVLLVLIALATLVSEDLTSIGAGFLVAQGTMDFFPAMLACFVGIFIGDVLLFLAGRWIGRPIVRRAPMRWFIGEADLARGEAWLARRGPAMIMTSRFVPGSRLPTYVAAGLLDTGFWKFSFYFLIASAVWTPLLVGLSVLFGSQMLPLIAAYQNYALLILIGVVLVLWVILKTTPSLFSHRGRRLLVSSWRRKVRWEFWPPWFFYPPVVLYVAYLALRHRSPTLFTAANPAMPAGGFVGESKAEILASLREAGDAVARFDVIEPDDDPQQRAAQVSAFMGRHGFDFPIVLKPDVGERGADVAVLRSADEVDAYLAGHPARAVVQEYAPGLEYGVFYYRYPDEADGHIFSITDKRFPVVTGDGSRTLERLIIDDDRAVAMARFYLAQHQDRVFDVPAPGEQVQLVELGTHCRGAVFLDGNVVNTPALEAAIDRISKSIPGFYFGRYDIRTPSLADFKAGTNFKIVELNGVTSEATHIYDPQNSLWEAYRVLMKQWRIAFEIGAQNVKRGATPTRLRDLVRLLKQHKGPRQHEG